MQEFTITIYTENKTGLLNRITIIFTRRNLNIESVTISESEVKGVSKFTLVVNTDESMIEKVTKQIEKQVEVVKAYYHESADTIYQEVALYKLPTKALADGHRVEQIVRDNNARILTVEPEYIIIEKTGHEEETQALFRQLESYGILGFSRSGRVAIAKPMIYMHDYLKSLENIN